MYKPHLKYIKLYSLIDNIYIITNHSKHQTRKKNYPTNFMK